MAGPPTKIMIIRHGEKPPNNPGKEGPFDVKLDGESGGGKSLIVPGWQRAGALNAFFAPYNSSPPSPIAKPDYIYAADPKGESERPYETVTPLAAWLGYTQGSPQFNVSYDIKKGESDLVKSVIGVDGVVLICWEHDNIMPKIMTDISDAVTISNFSSIQPNPWPDVFYLVWILDLYQTSTGDNNYMWQSAKQNLMAGDV